ncbi:MAG: RnfABCDGE type electron transport complex subunit B [Spirochaetes bacterium]|jgi:electron transport complex protein RnfB|nr:RnfABCDGE type electron transport complex subunit B [Spirochaetota bacterium]
MSEIMMQTIAAVIGITALGTTFGVILSIAKKKLHVPKDPRVEAIDVVLPGANCGACGYPGCAAYADKIVHEGADIALCPVGGGESAAQIGAIMGLSASQMEKKIARVHCQGGLFHTKNKFNYEGPHSCRAANQIRGGFRVCSYGCLGLGDCASICPFNAISMGEDRLPHIDPDLCTGCGKCVDACPRFIISLLSVKQQVYVKCKNMEKGPVMKQGCTAGCIGCKLCVVKACKNVFADNPDIDTAITVDNFLAHVNAELCINCGECSSVCPQDVISFPVEVSDE